ncbi:probable LRR receptor-like serine/threonine-protein kinase At3g47570 [Phragmites australis]|uniref:probable LRR receptor-like serine/threonine-protein kinase At3g47570 n=1 Tax=Phragmites australis TaxID=29695 RepID=UPI002D7830CA|nr:probable LRR receptor-like serine/threonine-protein kinase At3g47570 [Phragmites australis]
MFPVLKLLLLPHLVLLASASCAEALPSRNETDQDALLAFRAGLSPQTDALASWEISTDFCRWIGVICSHRHKHRVSVLNLSSTGLVGNIAPSLGNLTHLRSLDLSYNLLHGEIPPEIGQLSQMSYLDLSNNSLQGEIPPTIGQLTWLSHLDLSNNSLQGEITVGLRNCSHLVSIKLDLNNLSGRIPDWLGGQSMLESMSLGKNRFNGIIPPSLGNLSQLWEVYLNDNHLVGPIPEDLGRLGSLKVLALQVNHLSGTVPRTVFNLSTLIHIGLQMNELEGTLPSDLGNGLPKIQYLILALNKFKGSIPASIANASTMQSIDLSGNNFTGTVPPEIGTLCPNFLLLNGNQLTASSILDWKFITFLANCTSLRGVALQNNCFGGVFPSSISNLSEKLVILDIGFNKISGRIPDGIGNFPKLIKLGLSSNQLTGLIPDSIGRLKMLQFLTLENNLLSGRMPSSLGNLTQLQHLSVDNNILEGPIPVNIGNMQRLVSATFSNNALSGPLPGEIFSLSSLSYILDLSGNHFSSSLPSEVGSLTKLTYLSIYGNNLSGVLPNALSNCQSLMELRLDDNSFNGIIPVSISKMRGLVLLNLTKNSLSGMIPQELGLMNGLKELYLAQNYLTAQIPETMGRLTSLYRLDISFNHLDGQVPANGVFTNLTGFSFNGNDKLCGGVEELHLTTCPTEPMDHNRRILRDIRKAITVTAIIILVCFILAIFSFALKKALRSPSTKIMMVDPPLMDDMYPRISYSDLYRATNGFSANNLIGTGQYGSVYKGTILLKELVTTVAVKVFDLEQPGSSKSFVTECKALSKIRHRNLIRIITCCSCSDFNQNDFKALVFDFMLYGSLDMWLHPEVYSLRPVNVLTLVQRLNIAADVATALDYLHNNCQPTVIHCDVKPRNILLGEDMVARVGDFGLTKILTDPVGEQLINSKSSVGILGTIGYVAPEYGEAGQISPYGDVYSFGIVLLEMFTGKAPTHDMFTEGLTLLKYAKMAYPARLMEIVDPLLLSVEAEPGQVHSVMNSVTRLALSCSQNRPIERLCMRYVVVEIHTIKACYAAGGKVVYE